MSLYNIILNIQTYLIFSDVKTEIVEGDSQEENQIEQEKVENPAEVKKVKNPYAKKKTYEEKYSESTKLSDAQRSRRFEDFFSLVKGYLKLIFDLKR